MENIGGITKPISVNLKKGLNIIKAPNATGKTSFIHALQTLVLPEKELKQHTEFLNDFENEGIVEIEINGRSTKRKLIRVGTELGVDGKSFYNNGLGLKASFLAFADPENKFLNAILRGESLDNFFEDFSDIKFYKQLEVWSEEKDYELAKELMAYRGLIENLEEKETEIKKLDGELVKLNKEKDKIEPTYNDLVKGKHDKKLNEFNKKRVKRDDLYSGIIQLKNKIQENKRIILELKDEIGILEKEFEEFKNDHPKYSTEMDGIKDKIGKIEKLEEQIEKEIEDLKNQKESTESSGEGKICNACGRKFARKERKKRLSKLNKELDKKEKEKLKARQKREELELDLDQLTEKVDKIFDENAKEIEYKQRKLNKNKQELDDRTENLEKKEVSIKVLEEEMKELRKDLDKRTNQIIEDLRKITESIGKINGQINYCEKEIERMEGDAEILKELQSKFDFIKRLMPYIKQKIKDMMDIVKNKFNQRITEVYKILGYKDFDKIEIDDMFKIQVRRKRAGRMITQELNRLSTSERVTIGVITMLAGKEEYLSDFPFFVLDEVTTAYDPERFEKIINYIQKHTPYTIVTTFSSVGEKIQIEYGK